MYKRQGMGNPMAAIMVNALSQILLLSILLGAMIIVVIMFFTEYKQYQTNKITTEFTITYQDISLVIGIIVFLLGKYLPLSTGICTILSLIHI